MDGTTYLGDTVVPGAIKFFRLLNKQGKKYVFITNNSSASVLLYQKKLKDMGIEVGLDQILTSGIAATMFLKKQKDCRTVFPLGTKNFEKELKKAGFILTDKNPDYVVLGFDKTLTYQKLKKACLFIRQGVKFVASHPDKVCPTEEGFIPDCGSMIALITSATGIKPKIIGKPRPEMISIALEKLKTKKRETAIIGDRLYTDIKMGRRAGIITILVLSGETKKKDLINATIKPEYVFASLEELSEKLRPVES